MSLEMLLTIGAPLQQAAKQAVNAVIPGRFYELYGLTEGFVTILDREDFDRYPDSVGCPPPGYEIRIVDDAGKDLGAGEIGEIVGRGPALSSGYYRQEQLTRDSFRDGWLYTGDLGYLDEDGFLYLAGRKKELIISGGVNVYPRDIEDIASAHEQVLEVAVFGVEVGPILDKVGAAVGVGADHDVLLAGGLALLSAHCCSLVAHSADGETAEKKFSLLIRLGTRLMPRYYS